MEPMTKRFSTQLGAPNLTNLPSVVATSHRPGSQLPFALFSLALLNDISSHWESGMSIRISWISMCWQWLCVLQYLKIIQSQGRHYNMTLTQTYYPNIAPEDWWLEDDPFLVGWPIFRVSLILFTAFCSAFSWLARISKISKHPSSSDVLWLSVHVAQVGLPHVLLLLGSRSKVELVFGASQHTIVHWPASNRCHIVGSACSAEQVLQSTD